jgi:hypothetical protein
LAIDALQSNGNNSLIELMQTCAPNSTDLIQHLNESVLQNQHLTNDAQLKTAFEAIDSFFDQNPALKADCQNGQLENGLDLHEFLDIGLMVSVGRF